MTTSQISADSDKISRGEMAYACARGRHQAHNFLLKMLKESGLTQKELAERAGIDAGTLSRALTKPNNYTVETMSRIAFAACGEYIDISRLFAPNTIGSSQYSYLNLIFKPPVNLVTETANKNGTSGMNDRVSAQTGYSFVEVAH